MNLIVFALLLSIAAAFSPFAELQLSWKHLNGRLNGRWNTQISFIQINQSEILGQRFCKEKRAICLNSRTIYFADGKNTIYVKPLMQFVYVNSLHLKFPSLPLEIDQWVDLLVDQVAVHTVPRAQAVQWLNSWLLHWLVSWSVGRLVKQLISTIVSNAY